MYEPSPPRADGAPPEKSDPRHFSMLRTFVLSDLLTLGNASAGTVAVFMCLNHLDTGESRYLWVAFALLPLALALDLADGFVARRRHRHSVLGADLDSLADVISFGVAPAVLAYTLGMRGGWDILFLVLFVASGIGRLARYNATLSDLKGEADKVPYYEGVPIPTSLLLVVVLLVAALQGRVGDRLWLGTFRFLGMGWHPLSTMFLLAGSAMASRTLRIPKP